MDTKEEVGQIPSIRVRIAAGGRVVIPSILRRGLGVTAGDELLLSPEGRGIWITTVQQTVQEVQNYFTSLAKPEKDHATPYKDTVDELIDERRREAKREKEKT